MAGDRGVSLTRLPIASLQTILGTRSRPQSSHSDSVMSLASDSIFKRIFEEFPMMKYRLDFEPDGDETVSPTQARVSAQSSLARRVHTLSAQISTIGTTLDSRGCGGTTRHVKQPRKHTFQLFRTRSNAKR